MNFLLTRLSSFAAPLFPRSAARIISVSVPCISHNFFMSSKSFSTKKKSAAAAVKSPASSPEKKEKKNLYQSESTDGLVRCWGGTHTGFSVYHDKVWGRPFAFHPRSLDRNSSEYRHALNETLASLSFQLFQSGLTWKCVFDKIPTMRSAFHNFDIDTVAKFDAADVEKLLANAGIIRNRLKVNAIIENAKQIIRLEKEFPGGFFAFLFADHDADEFSESERVLLTGRIEGSHMRSDFKTKSSEIHSSDGVHPSRIVGIIAQRLKSSGFKFVGETVVLSFLQASGLMNHHARTCFAFEQCEAEWKQLKQLRAGAMKELKAEMKDQPPQKIEQVDEPAKKLPRKKRAKPEEISQLKQEIEKNHNENENESVKETKLAVKSPRNKRVKKSVN